MAGVLGPPPTRLAQLAGLVLALASTQAGLAQAPDCTGVSAVFNTDPDLIGELTAVRVASGLSVPVFVTAAPGDAERLFIVEQSGRIKVLRDGAIGTFLDIHLDVRCCGEEGLLGLAFHPDYASNRHFFVFHTDSAGDQVVARFETDKDNPDFAPADSREPVITLAHPTYANHNGGMIAFGPTDGHLYIAIGDGGSGCDPGDDEGNGQNLDVNLGKLLRLNVDTLPATTSGNPLDGAVPGNDEIWSYGLRNPWRFSFDRVTGAIYIGDVGQGWYEEIDCSPAGTSGENYGWVNFEGTVCPNPSCGGNDCTIDNHVPPIREYNQRNAPPCAVIGGYVYRGCRMADLRGTYFYSDNCDDFVKTFRTDGACSIGALPDADREDDLEPGGGVSIDAISSFGEDGQGELYIADRGGEVFKILPTLGIMEVSGRGATPLDHTLAGLVWEDLAASSGHSIATYEVHRADGLPDGPFVCVGRGPATTFDDPQAPAPDQVFYYLVTATNAAGVQTVAGRRSDGSVRRLDPPAGSCAVSNQRKPGADLRIERIGRP